MKKIINAFILLFVIMLLSGCSKEKNTYYYIGQSDSWIATFSMIKVDSCFYNSVTIQSIIDTSHTEKIKILGPIEYQLNSTSMKIESSYPQELQGVGSFLTSNIMNADSFDITFDKEIDWSIQWNDKEENIKLIRQD